MNTEYVSEMSANTLTTRPTNDGVAEFIENKECIILQIKNSISNKHMKVTLNKTDAISLTRDILEYYSDKFLGVNNE